MSTRSEMFMAWVCNKKVWKNSSWLHSMDHHFPLNTWGGGYSRKEAHKASNVLEISGLLSCFPIMCQILGKLFRHDWLFLIF